jgi:RNA polymerase sigma-70 factor, ECF subfamily
MELATTHVWREGAAVPQADSRADEAHFQAFVERNLRFAFRVAWASLRNRADADDVAQECFLRLYRKRGWQGLRDERAYIARVVWRLAQDHRRSSPREEGGVELDTITAADHSPETAVVADHGIARIHRLIDTLPEDLRQPLVLSTLEEMTSAQIAATLGIPEGTVRTRIQRARALLKKKLATTTEASHAR